MFHKLLYFKKSIVALCFTSIFSAAILVNAGQAQEDQATSREASHRYLIPIDDGYGVDECLTRGGECARVVADAWCESHGHAHLKSIGPAEDVTASIAQKAAASTKDDPKGYVIVCDD